MSNTVCIYNIIMLIMVLSVKIKIKNFFFWTIISHASQKYKMRRNLEVNQSKPRFFSFDILTFFLFLLDPSQNRKRHRKHIPSDCLHTCDL